MAKMDKPLSASESAFIAEQTKELAEELAFYARGPVRISLTGDNNHVAYTYGCDDKLHTVKIVMNPGILAKIRNRDRAVAIWRGLGFHELAHHLWPAVAQYRVAYAEGFKSLFNLIDDEQNERRGRALHPVWGACFQTMCAYIFPAKRRNDGRLSTGISDNEETTEPEGIEAVDDYCQRWNEFAFYFRRHLEGPENAIVVEALSMIPGNFKDLSKDELLALTRNIHKVLARGVQVPARPSQNKPADAGNDKPIEAPTPPPPIVLPIEPPFWETIITSKWSYLILGAFVLVYSAIFLTAGFHYWLKVFFFVLGVVGTLVLLISISKLWHCLQQRAALARKFSLGGSQQPFRTTIKKGFKFATRPICWSWLLLFGTDSILWRVLPKQWLKTKTILGWHQTKKWVTLAARKIKKGFRWLWYQTKRLWRKAFRYQIVRIACVAVPMAAGVAMIIAVLFESAQFGKWMLVLNILLLLLMSIFGWLFRKKIMDFLLSGLLTDQQIQYEVHVDIPIDKETLSFNILNTVTAVEADPEFLQKALPEIMPIAQQLRPHIEKCGAVLTDKEDEDEGYDLVDELEQTLVGETSVFVDDVVKAQASVHIEVALDCSGSMHSPTETLKVGQKFLLGKSFALIVEESVRNLKGVSSHFWGYTDTNIYDCGEAGQGRISGLKCGGGNNDSAMLWHMGQSAAKSGKEIKILLMISDGQPSDCSWGSLHRLVEQFESDGMIPVQIAVDKINDPAFQRFFVDLVGQNMTEAVVTMGQTLASLVASNG